MHSTLTYKRASTTSPSACFTSPVGGWPRVQSDLSLRVPTVKMGRQRSLSERVGDNWSPPRKRGQTSGGNLKRVAFARTSFSETPPEDGETFLPITDPAVREIFQVPEDEILEGGDVLVLSLPESECVALAQSKHVAELLTNEETGDLAGSLRICNVDLLELGGKQNEFVELVVSYNNPFIGEDFTGPARRAFEKHYQVAVLAVRQNRLQIGASQQKDKLPSKFAYSQAELFVEAVKTPATDSTYRKFFKEDSQELEHVLPAISAEPQQLRQGDTILVLAKSEGLNFKDSMDFMVVSQIAHDSENEVPASDYIPLILFVIGITGVAVGHFRMLQVSMTLAAVNVCVGWVEPARMKACVNWDLLALIGCALGLAEAVNASGLSSVGAGFIQNANLGQTGTIFILFFFALLMAELVTAQAAAALCFPLALELTRELGFITAKPLTMTILLGTAAAFANPVSSPCSLLVFGPGGYSFSDFLKVGLPLDILFWLGCCLMIPLVFE